MIEAADGDVAALVARCLALASGKTELRSWSLQTGQSGFTTITLTAPRALKQNDVLFAVRSHGTTTRGAGGAVLI